MSAHDLTADEAAALVVAEQLVAAGIPVFAAAPVPGADRRWDPTAGCDGYRLPAGWQNIEPDVRWLDPTAAGFANKAWRPGWALAAVMGVASTCSTSTRATGATAPVSSWWSPVHGRGCTRRPARPAGARTSSSRR